jgi:hypothetical protein
MGDRIRVKVLQAALITANHAIFSTHTFCRHSATGCLTALLCRRYLRDSACDAMITNKEREMGVWALSAFSPTLKVTDMRT